MRTQLQWPEPRNLISGDFHWEFRTSNVGNPYHTMRDAKSGFHICVIWFDKETEAEQALIKANMKMMAEIKHDNKDYTWPNPSSVS